MTRRMRFCGLSLAIVVGWALSTQVAQGEEWGRFRGPNGTGVSTQTAFPQSFRR